MLPTPSYFNLSPASPASPVSPGSIFSLCARSELNKLLYQRAIASFDDLAAWFERSIDKKEHKHFLRQFEAKTCEISLLNHLQESPKILLKIKKLVKKLIFNLEAPLRIQLHSFLRKWSSPFILPKPLDNTLAPRKGNKKLDCGEELNNYFKGLLFTSQAYMDERQAFFSLLSLDERGKEKRELLLLSHANICWQEKPLASSPFYFISADGYERELRKILKEEELHELQKIQEIKGLFDQALGHLAVEKVIGIASAIKEVKLKESALAYMSLNLSNCSNFEAASKVAHQIKDEKLQNTAFSGLLCALDSQLQLEKLREKFALEKREGFDQNALKRENLFLRLYILQHYHPFFDYTIPYSVRKKEEREVADGEAKLLFFYEEFLKDGFFNLAFSIACRLKR